MKNFRNFFKINVILISGNLIIQSIVIADSTILQESNDQIFSKNDQNETTIRRVIQDEIPEFKINSMNLLLNGWDHLIADVNGEFCDIEEEWIFRFPREKEHTTRLERERKLLNCLKEKVKVQIPNFELIGNYADFFGYRKIPGCHLTQQLYLSLSNDVRESIAQSLALFFSQMHTTINVNQALEWGYEEYTLDLTAVESLLDTLPSSNIEQMIIDALTFIKQPIRAPEKFVLLHNDLNDDNLLFDEQTEKISGIIDFSDAVIGNYIIEFGCLFTIHPDLAIRTIKHYDSLNSISNSSYIHSLADQILRQAFYLSQARKSGYTSRESEIILFLEQIIPTWETLLSTFHSRTK